MSSLLSMKRRFRLLAAAASTCQDTQPTDSSAALPKRHRVGVAVACEICRSKKRRVSDKALPAVKSHGVLHNA